MYKNKIEEIIITFTDNKYTKIFDFEKEFYNINNICLEKNVIFVNENIV